MDLHFSMQTYSDADFNFLLISAADTIRILDLEISCLCGLCSFVIELKAGTCR